MVSGTGTGGGLYTIVQRRSRIRGARRPSHGGRRCGEQRQRKLTARHDGQLEGSGAWRHGAVSLAKMAAAGRRPMDGRGAAAECRSAGKRARRARPSLAVPCRPGRSACTALAAHHGGQPGRPASRGSCQGLRGCCEVVPDVVAARCAVG